MTIDDPIRRFLARVCSDDTMTRLVDPILADIQWERGRRAWLGYLALGRALALHAVTSVPDAVIRTCTEDGNAMPKLAGSTVVGTIAVTIPLIAVPLFNQAAPWGVPVLPLAVFLLPQALVLTIPTALMCAIPLAIGRRLPSARFARRTIAASMLCAAATFGIMERFMPDANQSYRQVLFEQETAGRHGAVKTLARGLNERRFSELRAEIRSLQDTGAGQAAREIEYVYQLRLALGAASVPLGLFALALGTSRALQRPLLRSATAFGLYIFLVYSVDTLLARVLLGHSSTPPVLIAWTPNLTMAMLAVLIHQRSAIATPPNP